MNVKPSIAALLLRRLLALKRARTIMAALAMGGFAMTIGIYVVQSAATVAWTNAGAATAWYTNTNWTPNTTAAQWLTSDTAQFNNTGTATTAGINMNTASLSIGAIEMTSARTRNLTIGNSNAVVGTLTLNGTTVNSVSNVILRNASGSLLTLQDNETGTGKTMNFALANATDNIVNIDGTGGVTISNIISGASKNLTKAGGGAGALTLSGVNTYSGDTTISTGKLALSGSGSIASSPNIILAGGATFDVSALTSALTLTNSQTLKASGSGSTGTIGTTTGKGLTLGATSGLQFTAYNGSTAPLTVTGASSITLASGNVVTVTVPGAALGVGDYKLIATGGAPNITAVNGTAPSAVTVNGAGGLAGGTSASLVITGGELFLHVIAAGTPTITVSTLSLPSFGGVLVGGISSEQSYTVSGSSLTTDIAINAPTDFEISLTSGSGFTNALTLPQLGGTVATTTIFVHFKPLSTGAKSGSITHDSTGATQKTVAVSGNGIVAEPTTQATNLLFSSVGATSMTLTWTNGNGSNRIVLAKSGSAVDSVPVDGSTYAASTTFGGGTQIGSGNFVVFNGTGNTVTVTGLAGGTTYHFAVFEFNGPGGTENYLTTSPATGSQATGIATYDWIGGSGDWQVSTNWSPTRSIPASSDILRFNDGSTETVTNVPTQTIAQLNAINNTNVTLQAAGTNALTINGGSGTDLTVSSGSQLNVSGTNGLTIAVATGATGSISGSMTFSGGAHRLTSVDASGITFQTGSSFTAGTGFSGNSFGSGTANSVIFASGSTYIFNAGSNPFSLTAPASVVVFQTGSLYRHQSSNDPSVAGRTYANFEYNIASSVSVTGTTALTVDNLTVTLGTFNVNVQAGVNIKGNISVATGATLNFNPAAPGTINLNGTSAQTISGAGTLTFGSTSNFTVSNSNGVSLLRSVTLDGTLTLATGTLSVGTNVLTLNGDTASTGGTLDAANGTVNYFKSGAGQNVFAADYSLLAFSGGSKILPNGGTVGIRGTFNPGGTTGHTIANSTVDFKGTGSQTIPVFNYYNLTSSSSGSRDFGVGIVGIANVFDPGTNVYGSFPDFQPQAGSIVEYNGSTAQTMPNSRAFKYRSLSIKNSNPSGVTAPNVGGQTILISDTLFLKLGPFTLAPLNGVTLANDATINRSAGTISAAPTFGVNPGDRVNVTYSEAGSLIPTGPELPTDTSKLKNLTLNNSAGVTLNADAQVNNQLIFTLGILFSGNKILTLGGTATTTGASANRYVDGYLQKLSVTSTFKFEVGNSGYSPVTLDTVVGVGTAKVRAFHGFYPRMPNHAITLERFWNLTKDGGITSSNITFQYPSVDAHGNESLYRAYKFNGSTVTTETAILDDTTDPNNHTEKVLAQISFSDWTFAELNAPTAVSLTNFDARSFADGVQLTWGTGFEVNNLGYHLYREQNGRRTRVTPSVVAGSALIVGPGRRLTAGYSYSWFDPQGTPDSVYSLEAIDLDGSSQWAGPVYPYAAPNGGKTRKAPRREPAMLLSDIAADGQDQLSVSSWPCLECGGSTPLSGRATSVFEDAKKSGVEPPHSKESVEPPHSKVQQSIAAGKAVKIKVRKSGWYRATQAELVAAGFDPSSDARMLQLYVDGEEVPISLSTESTRLGPNDTMEFYGVPLDTPTTDTRVYWLVSGSSVGKRMIARRGKLKTADPNSEIVSGSFDLTTERREKLVYFSSLLNGDADNIFGAPVRSEPVTQTLVARNVDRESVAQPRLEVALQGFTAGAHTVQLQLNGTSLGTMTFADRDHPVAKFSVSPALLREGDNLVSLASTNGQTDVSLIDWVRLTYARKYKAENNTLTFSALGGQPLRIEGFSSANVRVVDVTDPNSPAQLSASASASEGSYAVKVQPSGAGVRTLIAFTEDLMGHPSSITANQPSNWSATTNGADMVIITHKDFRQAIEPLANLRRSQGLSVAVVDVEDVFDEFSYGLHTPEAIKSFMVSAAANWSRKPAYLLLVGDSSWDPRNYFNKGENDFVPTKLIDTQGMETGSDDWLADFNNLGLPNMAVGRLPARTAAEVNLMVSKIMSYEQERELNAPLRGAVMVSDNGFETQSSQTRALLPSNVTVQTINRAAVGNDDIMRGQILDALNQGPMIVNYFGHGSVSVWTGAGLLNSDSAGSLTNANRLSVYVMMTCLNGYATDANIDSLGEAVLKAQNGGAVAVWASSGFTTPQPQFEMNSEFYRLLFSGQPMRLGDAARNAKAATSDIDVRRTWILLGDPAMRVR